MKNFLSLLKTNQNFKTKVLRATIFLCLFIVGISVFAFSSESDTGDIQANERNIISGNYIPGDSVGIAMNKEEIYIFEENMLSDKEISLGKSIVEEKVEQQNNNQVLEEYIKNLQESFNKVQSTENVIPNKETSNVENVVAKKPSSPKPKKRKIDNSTKAKHTSANDVQYSASDLEKRRILLQTGKRFSENSKNIKVNIDGNQTIKSGQYVRLKTMEDAVIENIFVPKYSPVMASVGFGENRIVMNVSSVRINNEIINCHFDVYGLDGLPGLPVNLEVDPPGIEEDVTNEVENEVRGVVSMTRVGRMASNIFKSKKKAHKISVKVLNNTNLILIKNK